MSERLYDDLAPWWPLVSPRHEYAPEAEAALAMLSSVGPVRSLLDLGSGGGHFSSHFPADVEVVLADRSPAMLAASRALMPDRVHVQADMRDVRLGRVFDAVLLHDAVMYLTSREDLLAAFRTAWEHLRPGGALLVLPDVVAETFAEGIDAGGGEDGVRAARLFEWTWDPDPSDETYRVDMAFLLRDADGTVRCVHDIHTMGLYTRDTFWELLQAVGFEPVEPDPLMAVRMPEVFLVRRPA